MSSGGPIDVPLVFAAACLVAMFVLNIIVIVRRVRSGGGPAAVTPLLAFATGISLVTAVGLIVMLLVL